MTHTELVTRLQSQFAAHADDRSLTYLQESGRDLAKDTNTYGEMDRSAREIAAWLQAQPGTERPVLLLFEPGNEFWRAFLGCLYAGATAIPAPLPHDKRSMQRVGGILRDANSSLAITTTKLRSVLQEGIAALELDRELRLVTLDEAVADPDSLTIPAGISNDNVAFLQYTSGSTGTPKGVAVTHGNLVDNEGMIADALQVSTDSVLFGWIPHFHDMGLISGVLGFFMGASIVAISPMAFLKRPIRLLKMIEEFGGTHTACPNFAYDLIALRVTPEQVATLNLSACKVMLNGAEPVRRHTIERLKTLLAPAGFEPSVIRPAYGMAECTLLATVSRGTQRYLDGDADALEQHRFAPATERSVSLVSSGAPGRGMTVRIVDPETLQQLPDDHVGEIWLSSASIASGYLNRAEETIERFHAHTTDGEGPYLRTGDLGLLHEGELYVTGRIKDLLIVNGRNLYPQDLEEFAQSVDPAFHGYRGVAVAVDINNNERVLMIQSVKTSGLDDTALADLANTLKSSVARAFDIPAPSVVLVNRGGIHLTTSGKVQRSSMCTAFLNGELTDIVHESVDAALAR
jgi:acyl-CoA synthetase (AMP-forming)/AMP-acid ligase II